MSEISDILKIKDPNKRFKKATDYCKNKVSSYNNLRYEVAELALGVCDIHMGGRLLSSKLSLTAFAKEVGLQKSTLGKWVREYRLVKNISNGEEVKKMNRTILNKTLRETNGITNKKEIQKIFNKNKKLTEDDIYCMNVSKRLSDCKFAICHSMYLEEIDKKYFDVFAAHIKEMHKAVLSVESGKTSPKTENIKNLKDKISKEKRLLIK